MTFLEMMEPSGFLDPAQIKLKGGELSDPYNSASPFPHVVIDDFLPEEVCEKLLAGFSNRERESDLNESFDRAQERLKSSYHPDTLAPESRSIFYAFNSAPFIKVLENITGIKGLIPDPYFFGGGLHEIRQDGHLSMHADFNHHHRMNLERRINVLIYLNKDWEDSYGGQLELWDADVKVQHHSIVPAYNRCVIFNTTSGSMHGNPQPVAHPDGISRKSVALYYYTATWSDDKRSRTTQFKVRPGTEDKTDWWVKMQEIKLDWLPPVLVRKLTALRRKA